MEIPPISGADMDSIKLTNGEGATACAANEVLTTDVDTKARVGREQTGEDALKILAKSPELNSHPTMPAIHRWCARSQWTHE